MVRIIEIKLSSGGIDNWSWNEEFDGKWVEGDMVKIGDNTYRYKTEEEKQINKIHSMSLHRYAKVIPSIRNKLSDGRISTDKDLWNEKESKRTKSED